jgi:hypothetical protein
MRPVAFADEQGISGNIPALRMIGRFLELE